MSSGTNNDGKITNGDLLSITLNAILEKESINTVVLELKPDEVIFKFSSIHMSATSVEITLQVRGLNYKVDKRSL